MQHLNVSYSASGTEFFDGVEFSPGPLLLNTSYYHCTAEVEPGKVLVAGGARDYDGFYIIDVDTGDVTMLPDIPLPQYYGQACGTIPSDSGGVDLVVAGGQYDDDVTDVSNCCVQHAFSTFASNLIVKHNF